MNIIQNSVKSMHKNYLKQAKDSPKEICSLSIHGLHHLSTFSIKRFIIDYKVHLSQDCSSIVPAFIDKLQTIAVLTVVR